MTSFSFIIWSGLGGHWGFMTGDLKDGVISDILDHVGIWLGRYPEIFMKIRRDMAEKQFVPSWVGVFGVVFSVTLRIGFIRTTIKIQ